MKKNNDMVDILVDVVVATLPIIIKRVFTRP